MNKTRSMQNKKKEGKIKYPATCVVHTPSGAVNSCEEHAYQIEGLASAMGWHVNRTVLDHPVECANCANQKE